MGESLRISSLRILFVFLIAFGLVVPAAFSQGGATGAISGTVLDTNGG